MSQLSFTLTPLEYASSPSSPVHLFTKRALKAAYHTKNEGGREPITNSESITPPAASPAPCRRPTPAMTGGGLLLSRKGKSKRQKLLSTSSSSPFSSTPSMDSLFFSFSYFRSSLWCVSSFSNFLCHSCFSSSRFRFSFSSFYP